MLTLQYESPARRRRPWAGSLIGGALLVLIALSPNANAERLPRLLKAKWIEVETTNFKIKSTLSEKRAIELGEGLEQLRYIVLKMSNAKKVASPVPTEIFALKKQTDLREFGVADRDVRGFFQPGIRRNLIVMTAGMGHDEHVIQHEYLHFLIRNHDPQHYPKWYDEGFAELMASTREIRGNVHFGDVPSLRAAEFSSSAWLPILKVITADRYDEWSELNRSKFYAEAWLLVHYLQLGRPERNFKEDLVRYLEALESGVPPLDAFERGFELDLTRLDRELINYGRKTLVAYKIPTRTLELDYETKIRRPDRTEMSIAPVSGRPSPRLLV
jgi:hypothetical protein